MRLGQKNGTSLDWYRYCPKIVEAAPNRVRDAAAFEPLLLVGRANYPTAEEVRDSVANRAGANAEAKRKRNTCGRALLGTEA